MELEEEKEFFVSRMSRGNLYDGSRRGTHMMQCKTKICFQRCQGNNKGMGLVQQTLPGSGF